MSVSTHAPVKLLLGLLPVLLSVDRAVDLAGALAVDLAVDLAVALAGALAVDPAVATK